MIYGSVVCAAVFSKYYCTNCHCEEGQRPDAAISTDIQFRKVSVYGTKLQYR